jgi:hypothetical protein
MPTLEQQFAGKSDADLVNMRQASIVEALNERNLKQVVAINRFVERIEAEQRRRAACRQ